MTIVRQPIKPELRDSMNRLAKTLSDALPDGFGFALLVFNFGEGGFMNYISNSERDDMKKALREFLRYMETEDN